MSLINWEDAFNLHNPLNVFATRSILVPTYGNYGGPAYTAGQFGATTPEPSELTAATQPLDQLDALFYQHDRAYQHFSQGKGTFLDIVSADVRLILNMAALTYTDPADSSYDPDAGLFGQSSSSWGTISPDCKPTMQSLPRRKKPSSTLRPGTRR